MATLIGRWGDSKALTREDDGTVREIPFAAYYEGDDARTPEVGDYLCLYLNDEGEIARWEFCVADAADVGSQGAADRSK